MYHLVPFTFFLQACPVTTVGASCEEQELVAPCWYSCLYLSLSRPFCHFAEADGVQNITFGVLKEPGVELPGRTTLKAGTGEIANCMAFPPLAKFALSRQPFPRVQILVCLGLHVGHVGHRSRRVALRSAVPAVPALLF